MYSLYLVLFLLAGATSPQSVVVSAPSEEFARMEVESLQYCEILDVKNVGLFDLEEEIDDAYVDALADMVEFDLEQEDFADKLIERIDVEQGGSIAIGSRVTSHLHPGLTFVADIYDQAVNWFHVECTVGGLKGWVKAEDLELA